VFKELLFEKELPELKKGQEYKIYDADDPDYEPNIGYGIYIGKGKGRLSPNKGKDVYIFKATKNKDEYINGKINAGVALVKSGRIIIEEV
jgi:hypothetical protein